MRIARNATAALGGTSEVARMGVKVADVITAFDQFRTSVGGSGELLEGFATFDEGLRPQVFDH